MKVYTVQEVLEATKKKLRDTEAERDALNSIIVSIQNAATEYLQPDGDTNGFINRVIYLVDGPEQRAAQQCLLDIKAEAGRAGFVAGCYYENAVHFNDAPCDINIGADQYAAKVRRGGAE